MQRGLLIIGGVGPSGADLAACARGMDFVTAADSGLDAAIAAGIVPDLVVGDMDSLSDRSLLDRFPAERVLVFPRDKDETDTEIGLRVLRERGYGEVTIAGGGGGRVDHLLAVAALFEREHPPVLWRTDREEIHLASPEAAFDAWEGCTVSVFPLGERAAEMRSEGLYWPLDGLVFRRGYPGISNRATSTRVRIMVGIGRVLVVKSILRE